MALKIVRTSNKHTDHTKRPNLALSFWFGIVLCCLSGCSKQTSWDDSYNLREWERAFLNGESYDFAKKYDQAQINYCSALGYLEKLPPNTLRLADTLSRYGNAATKAGDPQTAESSYRRAVDNLRSVLQQNGSSDLSITQREHLAYNLSRLGILHETNQKFEDAEKELTEALAIYQKLGVDGKNAKIDQLCKIDYATTLGAALHTAVGQNKEAQARKLYASIMSPGLDTALPPVTMDGISRQYASMLNKEGHGQEAKDVLASGRCRVQCKLGFDGIRAGDLKAAEEHYQEALRIAQRMGSSIMLSVAHAGLGDVCLLQRKLPEAQKCFQSAVNEWSATDSKPNHGTDGLLQSWAAAAVFEPLNISEPILTKCINSRTELYGAQNEQTAAPLLLAALVCDYQKDPAKASAYAERAFSIAKNSTGKERVDAYGTQALGDLFFCLGQYEKAAQLYTHLSERNKFYRRSAGFNEAELLFRLAALQNCQGQLPASRDTEAEGLRLIRSFRRPQGVYFVAKSLAYLSADLQRHSQTKAAAATIAYLRQVIAKTEPTNVREDQSLKIVLAAIQSWETGADSHLRRIIVRPEPGSLEDSFKGGK